jgi:hypothetical protein
MADDSLSDISLDSKLCGLCQEAKPLTAFYINKRNGKPAYRCKACLYKQSRAWAIANSEKCKTYTDKSRQKHAGRIRARSRRWTKENPAKAREFARIGSRKRKLKTIGITEEFALAAYEAQGGVCAICRIAPVPPLSGNSGGQLDHCHSTMKFRGILCWHCNTSIGKFEDDPERMIRAAAYVRGELYPWFSGKPV